MQGFNTLTFWGGGVKKTTLYVARNFVTENNGDFPEQSEVGNQK